MINRLLYLGVTWAVAASALAAAEPPPREGEGLEFFEKRIRPLLAEHCYQCHSLERGKSKGGLTLDTRVGWQKGGDSGAAIEPGNPDKSILIRAIRYDDPDLGLRRYCFSGRRPVDCGAAGPVRSQAASRRGGR